MKKLTLVTLLLAAMPAYGKDTKIYNGAGCHAWDGADEQYLRRGFGGIENNSAVAGVNVFCPIVRDNEKGRNGLKHASIRVQSANLMLCTIWSNRADSESINDPSLDESTDDSRTSDDRPVTIRFRLKNSAKLGSYGLGCGLPVGGKIFSYKIVEH